MGESFAGVSVKELFKRLRTRPMGPLMMVRLLCL